MPKGYTDKIAIENYLLQEIEDTFNDQLNDYISSAERIIDEITGRNFVADSEASARLYDGDGSEDLLIDDCIEVTEVAVGNDSYGSGFTTVAATGADRYFTYPANNDARNVPIDKIRLNARLWTIGNQNNKVTAKWGYSEEAPEDIRFAATVFVAGILNQNRQGGDQIKSERIGNYQVTYNSDNGSDSWADFEQAKRILDRYKVIHI